MTGETLASGCCGGCRPLTLSDYIDGGMRRMRTPSPPVHGPECADEDGRLARFGVELHEDVVAAVGFRATSCATLIAYCELAAERVTGRPIVAAVRALDPGDLARALPSVPAARRERALLASRALVAALADSARIVGQ